jgi:hypothetical protein
MDCSSVVQQVKMRSHRMVTVQKSEDETTSTFIQFPIQRMIILSVNFLGPVWIPRIKSIS